jgi:hypothetical protein
MATTALRREIDYVSPTRQRVMGTGLPAAGLWDLVLVQPECLAGCVLFGLTAGGAEK